MDFSIDEKPQEVPIQKSTTDSPAPVDNTSGLPSSFGQGVSSHFEDDLMREFDQKHSKLSSFLEDRVSDLTTGLKSQLESQVPTGEEHFKLISSHDDDYNEYEIKRTGESKLIGDVGAGAESLLKLSGEKTESAAGDHLHGKVVLDEHEQLMGQFERVSPNMNFAYEDPVSRSHNDILDFQSAPREVPLPGNFSAPSFGHQTTDKLGDEYDEEDDFEKDSISQQSQPLSSKLSDSLEALKDIPREFPSQIVYDHFSAPPPSSSSSSSTTTTKQYGRTEDEDNFEKDSISSHPLSSQLSDSLEVLKDSPQRDLRLDESLMDLDELPSSKNSLKSISPNEGANVVEDFSEIERNQHGNLHEIKDSISSRNMPDVSVLASAAQYERPTVTNSEPFDRLPDRSPVTHHPVNTGSFGSMSDLDSHATPFGVHSDSFNNSTTPFGNLSDLTATSNRNNSGLFGNLPDISSNSSPFGNLPDITNSTSSSKNDVFPDEDIPPPIPPHQNLGAAVSEKPKEAVKEPELFETSYEDNKYTSQPKKYNYDFGDDDNFGIGNVSSLQSNLNTSAPKYEETFTQQQHVKVESSTAPQHSGFGYVEDGKETSFQPKKDQKIFEEDIFSLTGETELSAKKEKVDQNILLTTTPPATTAAEDADLDDLNSYVSVSEPQNIQTTIAPTIEKEKEIIKPVVRKEPAIVEKQKEQPQPKPKAVEKKELSSEELSDLQQEIQLIFNTFDPRAWFDPKTLHPRVSELVYWRDPKKSGIVFGSIFIVLLALTFFSLISVVAYTSLAVLSGTLAFRVYKSVLQAVQKTTDGHPYKEYLDLDLTVSNEKAQEVSTTVVSHLNVLANKLRSLFLVEDIVESAKFGGFLYFLTYLGAWFNGLTLVILGFIALFGLPKVYETNKTIIDQYIDLVLGKVSEVTAKVSAVIPFGKKEKAQ